MPVRTDHLRRLIRTLELAFEALRGHEGDESVREIYRAACVKEFELLLEQGGNLLRKRLRPWFATDREADGLPFKDLFREAARRGLIPVDACERWLEYRDSRNFTAHEYGAALADEILELLPRFLADARRLADAIEETTDA